MIYTITPNPALDLGGMIEKLIPNEKAYVHDETRFPGGNAINAARIIKKMGVPVVASGFLGGGIGKEIEVLLQRERVHCHFIPIQGQTRVGVTISNRNTHLQTRLSFPGPKIRHQEIESLARWTRKIPVPALVVIGGSLPPGFTVSRLKAIIHTLQSRDIPCIVDVPGKALKDLVNSRPFLIKPNLTEFQELLGKKISSIREVSKEARILNQKIPFICISSVEGGALLVARERVWFGKIPPIQVKTTVGAGDSMVGAMTAQIWKHRKTFIPLGSKIAAGAGGEDLLRWGLAAAAATLITPGTKLGEYKQMVRYFNQIQITEVF